MRVIYLIPSYVDIFIVCMHRAVVMETICRHGYHRYAGSFFFYGIGVLIMLLAYRFEKLSVIQPMLSLNYVLSIILASIVLKESITVLKCIGVIVIITLKSRHFIPRIMLGREFP